MLYCLSERRKEDGNSYIRLKIARCREIIKKLGRLFRPLYLFFGKVGRRSVGYRMLCRNPAPLNHPPQVFDAGGKAELCGPCKGYPGVAGMVIFKTQSYEEADRDNNYLL